MQVHGHSGTISSCHALRRDQVSSIYPASASARIPGKRSVCLSNAAWIAVDMPREMPLGSIPTFQLLIPNIAQLLSHTVSLPYLLAKKPKLGQCLHATHAHQLPSLSMQYEKLLHHLLLDVLSASTGRGTGNQLMCVCWQLELTPSAASVLKPGSPCCDRAPQHAVQLCSIHSEHLWLSPNAEYSSAQRDTFYHRPPLCSHALP